MPWDENKSDDTDVGLNLVRIVPPILIGAVLIVFFLANTDSVEVNFLFTETEAPLIVVLLITALLGAVLGWFVRFLRRRG